MANQSSSTYFFRGGRRVDLEEEEDVFTFQADDQDIVERLDALDEVVDVKHVQRDVFRVKTAPGQRETLMRALRDGDRPQVVHAAYRPTHASNTRYYLTNRVVLKFREGVDQATINAILAEHGLSVIREYGVGGALLVQVSGEALNNPLDMANRLQALEEVTYAEPNLINRFESSHIPADTLFDRQWHLEAFDGGAQLDRTADVSAPQAWDITRGSRDIVVAVIDDGFDLAHPDFSGAGKIVQAKDYVDGDASPFPSSSAGDYHGTPCAGVAIAEENGQGVVGVAPGCAFMPVRFPLSADDNDLWDIFDFVGRHADVISCSWGPPPVNAPQSQLLKDKFSDLTRNGGRRKLGVVIVFAAGNYNAPLKDPDNTGFLWRRGGRLVNTTGPIENGEATHPDVIAVAATTSENRKAFYSNWGDAISVSAPSNNFHPLDQQASAPGRGIWTTDNDQLGAGFTNNSRFTGQFGGTSSATPLVAGIAALALSANPSLTGPEVKNLLEQTADRIVDTNPDPVLGNRFGDYENGHSRWFGHGKINAATAVAGARELAATHDPARDLPVGTTARGELAGDGAVELYRVVITDTLALNLVGPDDQDFDLYVKRGSPPTTSDYDARGYTSTARETVSLAEATPGTYYVLVRAFRGAGAYSLNVGFD